MYTHHNSVLSWLLWDSLATLLFLTESRAHASANSDLITNLTTQQVSVNPGLSHLLTVIVVQVSISMQTKPLPLPLLEWNKHTVIIKLFLLYTNQSHSHTNSRRQNLHICLAVHVPARLSVTCTTVHNASNEWGPRNNFLLNSSPHIGMDTKLHQQYIFWLTTRVYIANLYFEEMKLMKFGGQNKVHIWLWGHKQSLQ